MSADKLSLAKKLRELALRGSDGEREAAQEALDMVLKKYNLSLEEVDDEQPKDFEFRYHGDEELGLLRQISYKVFGEKGRVHRMRFVASQRLCRNTVGITCTEAQRIEIDFLFDFYKRLYQKEKEIFFRAFIEKHRLFGESAGEGTDTISDEEYRKILAMMNGLSTETPKKLLED